MNRFERYSKRLFWAIPVLVTALVAGCGGGSGGRQDPILGTGANAVLAPTVTAVAPVPNATGVPVNNTIINAVFSEPMAPLSGGASFTVTCALPCANPVGTVTLDSTNRVATFTLASGTSLAPLTLYTATITGARSIATGLSLASPYVWQFTTGITPDTTRPRVILTVPATTIPGPTTGAAINSAITAAFSKDMAPATINGASFTVTCVAPCVSPSGSVSYAVGTRTAAFTPTALLAVNTTYTATITTAATDLSGNALAGNQAPLPAASNYVWTFTTGTSVLPPVTPPVTPANVSVQSTNPSANASNVCPNAAINATFNVPSGFRMDPLTVTTATFTVVGPPPASASVVASSVVLDSATGRIATFTPQSALAISTTYTATIKGGANGVKDTAIPANTMLSDFIWSFTTASSTATCNPPPPPSAVPLGSASTYGIMSTSAITSTGPTLINGNVALSPGTSQGIPPPQVNGVIHVNDAAAAQAKADLLVAYNYLKALPPGVGPNSLGGGADLSGKTLPPGTYTSATTILIGGPAPVTLDAGGNANAVWVFQIGSSLTTVTGSVLLTGGAQAKNVFWVPTADATIGTNTIFQGTIVAGRDVTSNTGAVINGRILAGAIGAATVALQSTTVNVPAP